MQNEANTGLALRWSIVKDPGKGMAARGFALAELVLLLAGRVDYTVENMTYSLRPWDVLLVKHHTIHKAVIDRSEPYDRVIVYLDRRFFERSAPGAGLMDCFDWADRSGQYLLTPNEEQKKALAEAMTSYEALIGDAQLGAQLLRDSCISRLLVHVNRLSVSASLPRRSDTAGGPKIAQALEVSLDVLFGLGGEEPADPAVLTAQALQALPEGEELFR